MWHHNLNIQPVKGSMKGILTTCSRLAAALLVLPIVILAVSGAWAIESNQHDGKISLTVNEEPLSEVLKKIAKKSGYDIIIQSGYAELPISISFKDLTLHQALRRVLGNLNRYVVINETDRKVTFGFVGNIDPAANDSVIVSGQQYNVMDLEVVPPDEPGGPSITLRDLEAMLQSRSKYTVEDIELAPPDQPNQKSITVKDVKEKQYDPEKMEIIPPDSPGKKGLTLNEIEAQKAQKQ